MSEYTQRMTVIVPELFIDIANHLALLAGESGADINTFSIANWQDADGNLYAVCSTVIKPIVLSLLGKPVTESILMVEGVDEVKAQAAMDKLVVYEEGVKATPDRIVIGVDFKPMIFFNNMGLRAIETNLA